MAPSAHGTQRIAGSRQQQPPRPHPSKLRKQNAHIRRQTTAPATGSGLAAVFNSSSWTAKTAGGLVGGAQLPRTQPSPRCRKLPHMVSACVRVCVCVCVCVCVYVCETKRARVAVCGYVSVATAACTRTHVHYCRTQTGRPRECVQEYLVRSHAHTLCSAKCTVYNNLRISDAGASGVVVSTTRPTPSTSSSVGETRSARSRRGRNASEFRHRREFRH